MTPNLKKKYMEECVGKIKEKFNVKNSLAVPRIDKVVINMGVGRAITDNKILDSAIKDLTAISGQKPQVCKAKKSVSNFKLREGQAIGCKVTLRRTRMYEFLDRLLNVTLPRIRDFNGVSFKSFDRQGNYTLGLEDQSIFPEIDPGRMAHTQGMDITIVFNKGPKEQTREVLALLGMPFRKK